MKIIGLTGLPRTGKDTLGLLLQARDGYHRLSFATHLYYEVAVAFGVSVEQLASHEWKTTEVEELCLEHCKDLDFLARFLELEGDCAYNNPQTSRRILQIWGTEYRRFQNPNYWTDRLLEDLNAAYQAGMKRFVVTDVRVNMDRDNGTSYNEFHALDTAAYNAGGSMRLVEVVRPGAVDTGHSTDARFPAHLIFATITNDRTPEELIFRARQLGVTQ